jgi:hypothetical protein
LTRHSLKRAGAALLLLTFALAAAVVPQFAQPRPTAAQTVQTSTPLNLCGTLQAYSQTAVTFTSNGVNVTYQIATTNTFTVQPAQIGQDLCFVGQLNAQAQIVSGTLTPNYSSAVVVCGNVNSYVTSSPSTTGYISIGASSIPIGINANFSGTAITVGQNLCINGQVNALGQLTIGAVSQNSGVAAPVTPTSACGMISGYVAPGVSTNGSVTIATPTVNVTYTIVAGATVNPSGFTGTTGTNVCLVGTLNAGGQLTRATFTNNSSQTITLCGVITAYTASTASETGSLTIGGLVVPLALSANFSGQPIVMQNNVCVQGGFNGLGQLVTGAIGPNPNAPTATPTVTLTPTAAATGTTVPATATPTATNTPQPAATATATTAPTATATTAPTATSTAVPTATSVPPTATPTPKPAKKYRAGFSYLSVWYHFIRVGTQETIVVQAKKHIAHGIWLTVRFPSGRYIAYYTNTDKNGFWSTRFTVPRKGLGKFTSEAVVTAQLWYKNTTAKSYATFILV